MTSWILLMRGINVGGKNILPMKTLRSLLDGVGAEHVSTYIQSGNALFRHAQSDASALAERICDSVAAKCGFDPAALLIRTEEFEQAIRENPFMEETSDPKSVHLWFLSSPPAAPDLDGIDDIKEQSERYALKGKVFYLHAPDGIGRSRLAAKAERLLGVEATARNWRTVSKLQETSQAMLKD